MTRSIRRGFCWLVPLTAAVLLAGCASRGFVRPAGPVMPFADGPVAWAEVTRECRDVSTYQAQLRVSGRVAGRRIPGLTVGLALDATGRMGMEIRVGGPPLMNLAGAADVATLVLHEQGRVVTAPAADIVEALVGVELSPARLLALLTGCVSTEPALTDSGLVDGLVRVTTPDAVVYLAPVASDQQGRAWRVRAGEFDGLLADYRPFESAWPEEVDVRSDTGRSPRVALSLRVVEFDVNSPRFNPAVFNVIVPGLAVPASLEELRESGPLGSGR